MCGAIDGVAQWVAYPTVAAQLIAVARLIISVVNRSFDPYPVPVLDSLLSTSARPPLSLPLPDRALLKGHLSKLPLVLLAGAMFGAGFGAGLPLWPVSAQVIPGPTTDHPIDRAPFSDPLANPSSTGVLQAPLEGYRLDTGDRLQIEIFDVPEYRDRTYLVLVDGSVSVPWLGAVTARGLTLQELASALTQSYRPFLKNPVITVNLLTPRPLRIGVSGEVNRPGSYTIAVSTNNDTGTNNSTPAQWPDVTRALTVAGGITPLADIRNIRLRRVDAKGNVQEQLLDLWQLLDGGDLSQNVLLRDGDVLSIPKATSPVPADIARLGRASFAPDTISVNVVGEVKAPGLIRLPPNATLNQALLAAGGFLRPRAVSSRVDLIRLNSDGSTTARRIPVDLKAGLNEENNPILLANDIVVVNTNGVARVSDFLRIFLAPAGDLDTTRRFIDSLLNPPNQPNQQ